MGTQAQGSFKDEGMDRLPSKPLSPTEVLAEGEGCVSREVYLRKEAIIRNTVYITHYIHIYITHAIYTHTHILYKTHMFYDKQDSDMPYIIYST